MHENGSVGVADGTTNFLTGSISMVTASEEVRDNAWRSNNAHSATNP